MSTKINKKNEVKNKQKFWTRCTKCKLSYITVSANIEHSCPEKFISFFENDTVQEQLFIFKNLVFLNAIEQPKGK